MPRKPSPSSKTNRQPIPPKVRYNLLLQARSRCGVCGATAKTSRLEVDHIIPIAQGGTNALDNLQVLCLTCNRGKGGDGLVKKMPKVKVKVKAKAKKRVKKKIKSAVSSGQ